MSKIKLFCFPYAGGSAVIYNKWKPYLDSEIELVPVELAGRGKRIRDAFYNDVPEVIEDVFNVVKEQIPQSPYALFGHSMGGMISYELAQKIRACNLRLPLHLFVAGRSAPHVKRPDEKKYHLMSDADFKAEVIGLGGTPVEFFEHPELMNILLPLLKNDFRIAEADRAMNEIQPLDGNITVFFGKDEDLTPEQCDGWKKHTKQLCSIHYFEGGHFFLHTQTEQIVNFINRTLSSTANPLKKF